MNKVILIGRVGKAPELKVHESGSKTSKFSLATTEGYGEKKETNWHNIVIWGDYGEKISQYINVGSQIAIEGRLQTSPYEKEGVKAVYTTITVEKLELLDKKSDTSDENTSTAQGNAAPHVDTVVVPVTDKAPVATQADDLPF